MAHIVCEECGKRYNYEKDDFCPRCGAFNQPKKTWGVDAKGNVVRIDGVEESNHQNSFVHQEVHHEKDERKSEGLDWRSAKGKEPKDPGAKPMNGARIAAIIVAAVVVLRVVINLVQGLLGIYFW
jgi:hypothetical protein